MEKQEIIDKYLANSVIIEQLKNENRELLEKEAQQYAPHKKGEVLEWEEVRSTWRGKNYAETRIQKRGVVTAIGVSINEYAKDPDERMQFDYIIHAFKKGTSVLSDVRSYPNMKKVKWTGETVEVPEGIDEY